MEETQHPSSEDARSVDGVPKRRQTNALLQDPAVHSAPLTAAGIDKRGLSVAGCGLRVEVRGPMEGGGWRVEGGGSRTDEG